MHNKSRNDAPTKPKDFKKSIMRLFKELNSYKVLVIISIILAVASTILTIFCPNKMADLTDEIRYGLTINTSALNEVVAKTSEKFASNRLEDIEVSGVTISPQDQIVFMSIMEKVDGKEKTSLYKAYEELPESIKDAIKPVMNMDNIKHIAILLGTLYIISSLFSYVQSLIMTDISNKYANKLRSKINAKINRLPLSYFDKTSYGDVLSRTTNDVDTIASSFNNSLSTLVSASVLLIGITFMMFKTNVYMSLAAILSSIIGFALMFGIMGKSQKYFDLRQKELGALNGHIEEVYSGLNVIKTYNAEEEVTKKFDKYNEKVYVANKKSEFLSGFMHPLMGFIGNLGYVSVCVLGAVLVSKNIITFGTIIAFISYCRLFTSPLTQLGQVVASLQGAASASERVFEFLDSKELSDESSFTKYLDKKDVKGNIEFKNVSFSYDEGKEIIKNFSAKCKAHDKIAIVGPTGAGKTTMVNLLMKFYEINKGDILIDDVSTKELTRENIHDLFTMVLQDTWLFNGTIKENLIYNRENITEDEIKKVCKIVGIDHFIKTLSDGYDTVINDQDQISIGQKQLLTIARAMLSDTPFIILDEATSNVDTRTEELVQKAMDKLMKNKTSFIIAHRLSTIKNADLILVMKDGNIIESGNHEELLKQGGFYSELYNSQFSEE